MSQTLLTPSQAAKILGVTRPGFVRMYKRGDIEPELVAGRQSFFALRAVNALKKARNGKKRKAA
jgi:hypothetical protein